MEKRKLLIVEDDPGLQKQLKWSFENYELEVAGDRTAAMEALRRLEPPVVTLDLGLPPDPANASEGLQTLTEILRIAPTTKVIIVTGNDDREVAVKAVGQGAYDFYEKPIDPDVLSLIVERAHRLHELEAENRRLAASVREPLAGVIAGSTQMLDVCRRIEKIAPTDTTVLLLGESGTGKEILARAIHELSPRRERRFVAINCAAIPETLLESELFGYEKGAFTGAAKQTRGKLEYADGGTLFLDEMGDLPTPLQAKLLRFLQERVIERIGGREEIAVETRVICATHKNIKVQIAQGQFREDLYYRISELTVSIPPLRERPGDSILIARVLLNKYRQINNAQVRDFSPAALAAIENYEWPGNVRELENRVKRAVIMADGPVIEPFDLELDPPATTGFRTLREIREEAEAAAIQQALAVSAGQVGKAAEMLGVSRPTVYHLMKKYSIAG
ncbi:MAG TPA: PEP-CTERM-box response regulator transcription factor [Gammaproteobacteria bacterium]|nr:PEP-CTERM-box response regulator transcription factor [Gammaproteobacteria bacterium]